MDEPSGVNFDPQQYPDHLSEDGSDNEDDRQSELPLEVTGIHANIVLTDLVIGLFSSWWTN